MYRIVLYSDVRLGGPQLRQPDVRLPGGRRALRLPLRRGEMHNNTSNHNDTNDDVNDIYIYIYIYIGQCVMGV